MEREYIPEKIIDLLIERMGDENQSLNDIVAMRIFNRENGTPLVLSMEELEEMTEDDYPHMLSVWTTNRVYVIGSDEFGYHFRCAYLTPEIYDQEVGIQE